MGRKFSSYFGFTIKIFFIKLLASVKLPPGQTCNLFFFYKKKSTAAYFTGLHPILSPFSLPLPLLPCVLFNLHLRQRALSVPVSLYNYPPPPQFHQMDIPFYTYIRQSMHTFSCLSFFYNSVFCLNWFWKAI